MRVLDPDLADLRALLSGPDAPTYVLALTPLDAWHIDPDGLVQKTLDQHYQDVGTVCGTPAYVHNGVDRKIPPPPPDCGCRRCRPLARRQGCLCKKDLAGRARSGECRTRH